MITGSVMIVTVMQVLDVTVTNVALPHMQQHRSQATRGCYRTSPSAITPALASRSISSRERPSSSSTSAVC
jgi:hypothetical protein